MSTNPKKQTNPFLKNKTPEEIHEHNKEFDPTYKSTYGYDEGSGTKNTGPRNEETDLGVQMRKMHDEKYDKFGRPREEPASLNMNSNNMYQYYGGKRRRKRSKKVTKKSKRVRRKSRKTRKKSRKSKHTKKHNK